MSVIDEYRIRLRRALTVLEEMEQEIESVRAERAEPIAVVGMACRLPGNANTPEAFFDLLENGFDAVTEVPPDRWALPHHGADMSADERAARWGAFLEHVDRFDASFFGISPREATSMDPQQRLVLEVAWEALERAGQVVDLLSETNVGVFMGVVQADNLIKCAARPPDELDFYDIVGNGHCFVAGRISYTFGFHGPCVTVDTACSSSLVAIHLACQSLRQRECDIVLSGGSNLMVEPFMTRLIATSHGLAPDGRCKVFDARANGFVRGEGVGIVVLKRLSDARRDGDPILALIRGSAINQDGRSAGIAAPNVKAQEAVLRQALSNASLAPESIGYVEMHGTGTPLGDPIEAAALRSVFGASRTDGSTCVLGAVKTNIAHVEAAAGVVGFIKVVQALQHERIPKNLHFNALNPRISLKDTSLLFPTSTTPWKRGGKPRYAGVSSFGMSGTNAHVILQEPPMHEAQASAERSAYLLPFSAKVPEALVTLAQSYADWLSVSNHASIHDVVYSASVRRTHHAHRLAVVARSREEFANALTSFTKGESAPGILQGRILSQDAPRVVFVFPGQGSQWVGMGRQLLVEERAFRASLEACDAAIRNEAGFSVLEQIGANESSSRLAEIDIVQPLLFAIEVALAALWRSWGVEPNHVIGHSMGEVAAAHVAGMLELEDAVRVICRRSKLLKRISGQGAMALVELPVSQAEAAIVGYEAKLSIAVSNGPRSTVLSGEPTALKQVLTILESKGIFCRWVNVDVASHSPQVEPLRAELLEALREVRPVAGNLKMRSTVTETLVLGSELNGAYWQDNLRQPVRFAAVTRDLIGDGHLFFVEMSPHPILLPSIVEHFEDMGVNGLALASMRRQTDERRTMLEALGSLHVHGIRVNWAKVYAPGGRVVSLPSYAWQHERFWIDTPKAQRPATRMAGSHPLLGAAFVPASQPELHLWEQWSSIEDFPYLADHRVQGAVVFPGACFVEMAIAAAREVYGENAVQLQEINLERMLALPENDGRLVQFSLLEESRTHAGFTISSKQRGEGDWVRHAAGIVRVAPSSPPPDVVDAIVVRARCPRIVTASEHYDRMASRGLSYGRTFQGISEVRLGMDEVMAQVRLDGDAIQDDGKYNVHPALLDACFQLGAWAMDLGDNKATFVPVNIAGVRMYERPGRSFWVQGRRQTGTAASPPPIALTARDDSGRVLFDVGTLRARALDASSNGSDDPFDKCIFTVEWRHVELPPEETTVAAKARSWLVLLDQHDLGARLTERLRARGDRIVSVTVASDYSQIGDDTYALNPAKSEHWERILVTAFGKAGCHGAIHCGALDGTVWRETSISTINADIHGGALSVLRLAQGLLKQGWRDPPRLCVLTRGAQAVGVASAPLSVAQSIVWGLGRVIATEQPEIHCRLIDLPTQPRPDEPFCIITELNADNDEDQVALRADGRYVARLVRGAWSGNTPERLEPADGRSYRLEIDEPGILERLTLRPMAKRALVWGEVEIEVEASGLNFRDVMMAMGIYPDKETSSTTLGGECAGTISALGPGVDQFRIGQPVIASAPSCFSSHVVARAEFVAPKPERLSFEEAATIPGVFMTVQWALHHVSRLRKGERILIHSATGGVGLAAIQYARAVGAEIFATAGSAEKRAFLRSMGVEHVMDSRSTDFADEVLSKTHGRGVDVVLNSLTGDALVRSLEVLAPFGRFLELGKKDIFDNRRLGLLPFRKSLSYTAIDLAGMLDERPADYSALMKEVISKFDEGTFEPEPMTVFGTNDASSAFRLMARAKHKGKIVVRMRDTDVRLSVTNSHTTDLNPEATYLLTGGLGGLGLSVAKWMVEHGARNLALVGRTAPKESAEKAIAEMQAAGCAVHVLCADVALRADVDRVLAHVEGRMPPLRGIVHAAGVLADRTVPEMDEARFFEAIKPKVFGAWNLHEATRDQRLDFFVMYSSAAGLLGSPGQANYAAANAFLDALGHSRVSIGLAGTSIQWGTFSEVGLAAASDIRGNRVVTRGGAAFTPGEGNSLLGRILERPHAEVAIMHFNVRQWAEFYPHVAGAPFLTELTREQSGIGVASAVNFRNDFARAVPSRRLGMMEAHLLSELGKVLRIEPGKIDNSAPFVNMGVDSLMSLELRNRLEASLGLRLSAALLYSYATPNSLAQYLADVLVSASKLQDDVAALAATNAPAPSEAGTAPLEQENESVLLDKLGEFEEYLR